VFEWLSNTDYAEWVKASWGWPLALTVHAFGNAIVVGFIFIICLRLLGLFRTIPYTSLNRLIPFIWVGVVFQAASGFTLFVTKPDKYLAAGMFEAKLSFVLLGIILTWYFQQTLKKEAAAWQAAGTVSSRAVRLVAFTSLAWAGVLTTGRLTAYLGALYS
jgi:hypothetical protein